MLKRGYAAGNPQLPARFRQCPAMSAPRMIIEVMQNHSPLAKVARPSGQRIHILFKLLDEALLVRGNNVHAPALARSG